ncbi:proline-rich protein 11 isoform X1 [Ictalurus punctatus]|uniref:Proline-rich protein 11 isoform X1 n=1 Tax=Ictalurus punctatus TaxID=7998 RepID=A0A2D0SNC9_ICTPU|nr:proline-rich protein 11 isoform X1 [Ictalurus punctatus]
MAGFGRLSRHFQKRRKKNGSSRRLAMKAKQSLTPSCDSQVNVKKNSVDRTKVELVVKTCNKNTERLSFSLRNGRLLNTVWKVMQQCQHRISQIWTGFCSVLFFWRFHAQRVEILHQKVEELQKELQLLRTNALLSPESRCSGCHGTTVAPPIALLPSPPLPPPPPPPPPPPAIQVPQRLPLVSKSRTSHSSLQEKVDRCVAVTLKDLQAVQLRKVTANNKVLMSPDGKRAPMVTLADLQKVSLRRVQCSFPSTKRRSPGRSSSKSPMKLRFQLRKIPIDRAPSDTPLCNKENVEKYSHISALINNVLENNCQGAFPGGS